MDEKEEVEAQHAFKSKHLALGKRERHEKMRFQFIAGFNFSSNGFTDFNLRVAARMGFQFIA